jgi:hypothetical protein
MLIVIEATSEQVAQEKLTLHHRPLMLSHLFDRRVLMTPGAGKPGTFAHVRCCTSMFSMATEAFEVV